MRKILLMLALFTCMYATATTKMPVTATVQTTATKYDIKIKNDSGDEVTVYNAGSGGSYRLQKNTITTIKMEEGDKLYIYTSGKKGKLLLTATKELDGKVQLFSNL